ncbi:lectin subunit alpha-like [Calliphora vicina]|uniref:lectin subunit alpha-like n=1 Tax=Calliphora vicina TaxID=7373 RepID=UPI00325B95C9
MRFALFYQVVVVLIVVKLNRIKATGKFYTAAYNKQYYIDYNEKYTWFEALNECKKINMTLVAIETQLKYQQIKTVVNETFGKSPSIWVGGIMTRYPDSRHFIWLTTLQPFNYTHWSAGKPDFYNSDEYCVEIGAGADMEWNDDSCHHTNGFICEYDTVELREIEKKLEILQNKLKDRAALEENVEMEILEEEKLQQELTVENKDIEWLNKQLQLLEENIAGEQELFEEKLNLQQTLQKQLLQMGEVLDQIKQND